MKTIRDRFVTSSKMWRKRPKRRIMTPQEDRWCDIALNRLERYKNGEKLLLLTAEEIISL